MNNYQTNRTAEKYFSTLDPKIIKIIPHELQLDFWLTKEESELEMLGKKVYEMNLSMHRVRRCIFAENGELKKRVSEMEERLAIIERNICYGK